MKIIYCIQGLWKTGGIERVVSTKANYWVQHGHQVWIVTTDQGDRSLAFPLDDRVGRIDLALNYEADNSLGRYKRMLALYRKRAIHRERLSKVLHEIKPDITVSTFFQEAPILPSIHDGSKKVLELHSSMYRRVFMYPKSQRLLRLFGYYRIFLDKRTARKYDRFVVLTHEDKGYWGAIPKMSVIPNPRSFDPEPADVPLGERKKVLAVGRYEYEKNFSTLIDIWQGVSASYPDWMLEIVGDGPRRGQLESQVNRLGLQGRVLLSGMTSDIKSHYKSASIMVMLSEYEGLPMVLVEAQTMGLPIVSYKCKCGPRDIITEGVDGYLIDHGDTSAFAKRLTHLMDSADLRQSMGQAAEKNSNRYSLQTVMTQWEKLFLSLAK